MASSTIQIRRWTRKEYDRLGEAGILDPSERVQLLEGDIVTLTPQNSPHAAAIGKTQRVLERLYGPNVWVRVQMPLIIDPDSEPEPDLAVVSGTPDDYVTEHPRTALLVVEVSDTTLPLDRNRKRPIYARAGIPEYWIVNLSDHCLEVYRDPITLPGQPASYRSSQTLSSSEHLSPIGIAVSIAVADMLS
ncbi:MAG: Uma2 family endonuclease [Nitrospirales bacterium]